MREEIGQHWAQRRSHVCTKFLGKIDDYEIKQQMLSNSE